MIHPPPDEAVRYDSSADIYRRAGIMKVTFDKIRSGPWCPDPSIYIGRRPGWDPDIATCWLRETGRIDAHGRPSRAIRAGRPPREEEPPAWYRRIPVHYLTLTDSADLLRHHRHSMAYLKTQGCAMRPAVRIGSLEGYRVQEVVRVGLQYGWLSPGDLPSVREAFARLDAHRRRTVKVYSSSAS